MADNIKVRPDNSLFLYACFAPCLNDTELHNAVQLFSQSDVGTADAINIRFYLSHNLERGVRLGELVPFPVTCLRPPPCPTEMRALALFPAAFITSDLIVGFHEFVHGDGLREWR